LNAQVLGASVDSVPCLKAWAESLGGISYPLLSDFWPHGGVATQYGVLRPDGRSERAIFVIDKQGIIRYVDVHDIDEQPSNDEVRTVLRRIDPAAAAQAPPRPPSMAELPHGGIVMYCNSWCPDCRRARAWLKQRGFKYTELDVNAVPAAATQVRQWANGNLVTPTFDIDGTIVIDMDERRLAQVLGVR
jgi:glutaredoxin